MTAMTLDELNGAIQEWQKEHNGVFIFLAKDETMPYDKGILSAYAGKGSDLSTLMGAIMTDDSNLETIVDIALKGLSLYRKAKQPCGLTN